MHPDTVMVIPGDDPPQLQGSPHLERLKSHGEIILHVDRPPTVEEQVRRAGKAVCLINSRGAVTWPGEVLRRLPRLKMITVCGIGTDAIDLEAAGKLGIVVCNLPDQTAPIVAEHALALMLAVARRAWFQTNELKAGRWTSRDNIYLRGKILGLVGAGSIAAELARLSKAIGMEVLAWTFNPTPERAVRLGATFVSLEELLSRTDMATLAELVRHGQVQIEGHGHPQAEGKPVIGKVAGARMLPANPARRSAGGDTVFEISTTLARQAVNESLRKQGWVPLQVTNKALLEQLRADGWLVGPDGQSLPAGAGSDRRVRIGGKQTRCFRVSKRRLLAE